jgi:hypothetical protein
MTDPHTDQPRESANAAQAFADYVALGPGRSLSKLFDSYQQRTDSAPRHALTTLKRWSTRFNWQARIVDAATQRTQSMLSEIAELDADTFAITSHVLRQRLNDAETAIPLEPLLRLRESVRPKSDRTGVTLNVNIYQQAERMAERLGITADELMADAERIAAAAWDGS